MSVQFRVGVFAVLTVIAIFVIWYVLQNLGLRRNSYTIAVHFRNLSGLQVGSSVQLAGVDVGIVDDIKLLPDQTADAICAINADTTIYRGSAFIVATTLTGQSTLTIRPPANIANAQPLPREILPEDEQPEGTLPPSIADLASQGQAQLKQLNKTLSIVNQKLPIMAERFTDVATRTDQLISHADLALRMLAGEMTDTVGRVDTLLANTNLILSEGGRNINQLTGSLRQVVVQNQAHISTLIQNLAATADNLNKTMNDVASITSDPTVKANLIQTTANINAATEKLKEIATNIQSLTGDPQVQGELRGAIYDLSSSIAKADDILGSFSNAQARTRPPAPGQSAAPASAAPGASTAPQTGGSPPPRHRLTGRGFRGSPLAEAQIRETWGTHGGGPNSDLNISVLPRAATHFTLGANDLGYHTTYNFLIDNNATPQLQYSFGLLYSNLGLKTIYRPVRPLGIEARLYDPKHPKLDLYGDVQLTRRLQLFYGERSLIGPDTKLPSFGLQINY